MATYPYQASMAAPSNFRTWQSTGGANEFESAADTTAIFRPSTPVTVFRWGFMNSDDGIIDVGTTMIVALDWRPTAGSDTGRVELSTITTGTTDVAVGTGLYSEFGAVEIGGVLPAATTGVDGSTVHAALSGSWQDNTVLGYPIKVNPGEELVFEVTNAADTNADLVTCFLHYIQEPFVNGDGTALRLAHMTKKAS